MSAHRQHIGDEVKPGIYIGIDSGGTRTNVQILLIDRSGEQKGAMYEVSDSLSGAVSQKLIPTILRKVFAPLDMRLAELSALGFPCFAWISSAGFSPWTREDYAAALDELRPTITDGLMKSIGIANDAVTVLMGFRADGIIIAGTGSNTLVKSRDGSFHQAGGREWAGSDYGSGFWIGLRAIRQAYRDFEAGEDSVLLQRFRQFYGIRADDDRAFIGKIRDLGVSDDRMKKEIARFTISVCDAAERGDLGAQNIVKSEAEDLADVTAACLRRRFTTEELATGIRLVQVGSVLGNSFYRSSFESQIQMRLLSGTEQGARIEWQREATGASAAVQLAQDLLDGQRELLELALEFRPVIVNG